MTVKLSEGQFQKQVIAYLKSQGVWYVKYWGGAQFTKEGVPDILACINGEFHGIELKSDGTSYNETVLQALSLTRINRNEGQGYVLRPTKMPKPRYPDATHPADKFDYYCMTFNEWKRKWFKDE
ncbi:hypothetical protein [Lactiplantibacillus plantarum]|uniref:hypothetical protein n=1 Tax=Lactiplantibacillus plantarum TaxID=1590 RepID=UPI001CA5EC6A|nr:hypothetical protein [Lactiplantibacillus plantarum]WDQ20888.1 hypothetical protein PTW40_14380 [Lactiplantibacillus plantarum]